MANSKITDLTELTSVDNADVLVIVDSSVSETKKISFANLSSGISVGNATELQFTALNSTGATITKGSPVYVSGHTTETQVADADNSSASTMPAFGIAKDDIANGATGTIVIAGEITGINTSSFTVGDELYVGTGGALTATKPTGTALIQKVAKVTKAAASGEILVTGAGRTNDLPNLPDGNIWIGDASGVPQDKTLTAGTNVTITEDATTVTIAATGGGGGTLDSVTTAGNTTTNDITVGGVDCTDTGQGSISAASNGALDGTLRIDGSAGAAFAMTVYDSGGSVQGTITPSGSASFPIVASATYQWGAEIRVGGSGGATSEYTLPTVDGVQNQPIVTDGSGACSFSDTIKATVQGSVNGTEMDFKAETTASSTAGDAEGNVLTFGTTTGLTAGSVYVWNGTDWVAVDADAEATTKGLMGVALGTSAATGFLTHGTAYLNHDPGTAGDILYVDTVTARYLTSTQPSATGDFVRVAGYCLADNKVFFSPSQDWIEIA